MNNNTKEALLQWRKDTPDYKYERLNPTDKAKANPSSKVLAIRAYCWECCCENKDEVTNCAVTKGPLHPHRPWQKSSKED